MIADYRYDETSQSIAPHDVRAGSVIFVKSDYLAQFFTQVHPQISDPYILISHNSDYSAPASFRNYLNDTQLKFWYAQNCDHASAPNLMPVPIGLENRHWKSDAEFQYLLKRARTPKPMRERSTLLFVALGNTNPERAKMIENVRRQNVSVTTERLSFTQYIDAVSNSKYVLSPPGNGLDCHRTWEAVALGAIPIVQSSSIGAPLTLNLAALQGPRRGFTGQ